MISLILHGDVHGLKAVRIFEDVGWCSCRVSIESVPSVIHCESPATYNATSAFDTGARCLHIDYIYP